MKKGILAFATLLMAGMLLLGVLPLLAQDQTPRVEVFGGYSYVSADFQGASGRHGLNGWNGQLDINLNRWLGLTGDFGGYYGSVRETVGDPSVNVSFHDYSFLFGPTLTYRSEHVAPFFHALFGGNHLSGSSLGISASTTAFAMAIGGGLDIPLTPHFGLRLAQADWVRTQNFNSSQNNVRLSTGLLFMFGGAPPVPVSATCSASPAEVWSGDPVTVTANGANFNPKHTVTYAWTGNGGKLSSATTQTATIDTTGLAPGSYTSNATISDPKEKKNNTA
ncbi:MAG: outer membrane beta-barrel protein, partial [Candidatus Korobacteraceae bacterium]